MSIGVATIFQQVCVRIHVEKIFSECLTPAIFFASITAATASYARMGGLIPKVRISDLLMSFACSGIHHRLNYKYSLQLNIAFISGETCQILFNEYINLLTLSSRINVIYNAGYRKNSIHIIHKKTLLYSNCLQHHSRTGKIHTNPIFKTTFFQVAI